MLKTCLNLPASTLARGVTRAISASAVRANDTVERPNEKEVQQLFNADSKPRRRHAFSMNRVELIGGVADTPVVRATRNGNEYVTFNLITNEEIRRASGERESQTESHNIAVFGRLSEQARNSVEKGSRLYVSGRLHYQQGSLKADGTRGPRLPNIVADIVQPLARRTLVKNDSD